ncbi:MAG: hypothetical protein QF829_02055 [Candidatus Hydrothermarchaeota archaeon]|nr:hypothetical protein [Candidatus Hydrothermarchaeota archaeon]
MAKVTRGDLKGIVKECLIEILAEGLLADGPSQMLETPTRPKQKRPESKRRVPQTQHEQIIQEAVSGLTDDPLMADIFSDTARGTLQEQLEAEGRGDAAGGDSASHQAAMADPDDLFGEAAEKWAALAFAGPGPANKSPSSE